MNPCSGKFENSEIKLRKVTKNDIKKIYEWRNHPEVRKWMFDSKEISWGEHVKFWEEYLRDKKGHAFIIIYNEIECGVIRLDLKSRNTAEVDIIVSPEFQGRGIGKKSIRKLIAKSKDLGIEKLIARVKPDNISSIKIFESNDFKLISLYYEKVV